MHGGAHRIAGALLVYLVGLAMVWSDWWHPAWWPWCCCWSSLSLVLVRGAVDRSSPMCPSRDPDAEVGPPGEVPRGVHPVGVARGRGRAVGGRVRVTQVGTSAIWGCCGFPGRLVRRTRAGLLRCLTGLTASWSPVDRWRRRSGPRCDPQCLGEHGRDAPRLPWVYKHIAVTRYIETFGSVDPSIDIYHRWPGFFSFAAFLGEAIGYPDPVSYAQWAETVFPLINVVLILAIARSISRRRAWYWTAAIVFTICNWVGQSYFAPQALAFSLYLALTLIVLTYLRAEPRRLGGSWNAS